MSERLAQAMRPQDVKGVIAIDPALIPELLRSPVCGHGNDHGYGCMRQPGHSGEHQRYTFALAVLERWP